MKIYLIFKVIILQLKVKLEKDITSKGNFRLVSLMNTDIKLLKILFSKFEFSNTYKGYYIVTK